jgi:primosomal protein N' (replication factor Y) (superfamily II helicase)
MYVIEVIPLTRGQQIASLTYYSKVAYEIGSIISIGVRQKIIRGLVISIEPVSTAKTTLRAATFTLRKLPEQLIVKPLPPVLLETARLLAKELPTTVGSILYSLLPEEIQSGSQTLESNLPCVGIYELPVVSVLQATEEERLRTYRSLIREAFAHRGSVLLVVPTAAHIDRLVDSLSQGITERVVTFTPGATVKAMQRSYTALHDLSQAKLVIVTPAHICLDRHDFTHIIIENSRSQYYKARVRPYIDTKHTLLLMAKVTGRNVILGDLLPKTEDEYQRRNDIYQTEGEHPKRLVFESSVNLIVQNRKANPDTPFQLLSTELLNAMNSTLKRKQNVFLFAARRGIAPVVSCLDCGHIFRCPDSGTPYSLLRTNKNGVEERWFISSTSGKKIKASDTCDKCGSWRLRERGIGIQHIYDELLKTYPKDKITVFDHTTATTKRKAQILMAEYEDKRGGILLATSMVLPYLVKKSSISAVVSLDATRAIASWRAEEEFLSLMFNLREATKETLYIQTQSEGDEILEYLKTGHTDQFYTDELALRESLKYPPFTKFIHLTISGEASAIITLENQITDLLVKFKPRFYSGSENLPNKVTRQCLIRVPISLWPSTELINHLKMLPPLVRIELDPPKIV